MLLNFEGEVVADFPLAEEDDHHEEEEVVGLHEGVVVHAGEVLLPPEKEEEGLEVVAHEGEVDQCA